MFMKVVKRTFYIILYAIHSSPVKCRHFKKIKAL